MQLLNLKLKSTMKSTRELVELDSLKGHFIKERFLKNDIVWNFSKLRVKPNDCDHSTKLYLGSIQ